MNESADGLADLLVAPHEEVATALDRHELRARDAGRRVGGGSVGSEGVVPSMDNQGGNRQLLEREPVRGEVRDEPVEDRAVTPGA